MRASVIIPARDEAGAIGAVIASVPRDLCPQIVVVDGGSRDDTVEIARSCGAEIVLQLDRGYGRAMMAGLSATRRDAPDAIVFFDGNGTLDGSDIPRLLDPIEAGEADLVLGCRSGGAPRWHQRWGNHVATWLLHRALGRRFSDVAPARAIRTTSLDRLALCEPGYGWPLELQVRATEHGLRIVEIALESRPRRSRSKVSGTLRGTLGASLTFLRILGTLRWKARA